MFFCGKSLIWIFLPLVAVAGPNPDAGLQANAAERRIDGIMDNSFFIEEAYNQEPGVVQHIFTGFGNVNRLSGPDDRAWDLNFTQEWPVFSQKHQFSYTVPYSFVESGDVQSNGPGDVLLNYRFQALFNPETFTAFAPRASLVLPTGDEERGFGDDTLGCQINLPFSTTFGDRWFVHLNAGATWLPDSASGRDLWHSNVGGSAIFAASSNVHFLVEWIGNWKDEAEDREFESIISPGVRTAFNFKNNSQLVLGVAAPIGLTCAAPDYGVFLYVSFEHAFLKQQSVQ
jgi:hypothetical protein